MILPIQYLAPERHPKAWGEELWIINGPLYCAKILTILQGRCFSLHLHWEKTETWYVLAGAAKLDCFDLRTAERIERTLATGDVVHVPAGNPHRLTGITGVTILEISTQHFEHDSYRVGKGDSQTNPA